MKDPGTVIEITSLGKSYGNIRALDGAELDVPGGMVFGLVGPNGSGKTTLIKALCGILKPDRGNVRLLGLDVQRDRYQVRSRIGYMPQTPSLYEDLSPVENMHFFGGPYHPASLESRIRQSLELVQLWERRNDPVHTFSGGMKQRTSLACSLLHDPELLILDEPTAGVDPTLRQDFWRHFHDLCDRGRTIFLSTNNMDEALRCHRVAVILGGRILISETPEAIRSRGVTRVTLETSEGSRTVEMDDYPTGLPQLLEGYGLDPEVKRITISRQSFEEVVLSLIGEGGDAE